MTVAEELKSLADECNDIAKQVSEVIAKPGNDIRKMCFWNIHNRVKLSEEIMTMYERIWSNMPSGMINDDNRDEISDRVMTITKDLYVDVLSTIEKNMKDSLKFYTQSGLKESALKRTSHLYMRNILLSCLESKLIDKEIFEDWDVLLIIRNLAAHNNSVADRDGRFRIGDMVISMRAGRMMKGPLDTYVILTARVIRMYHGWLSMMSATFSS